MKLLVKCDSSNIKLREANGTLPISWLPNDFLSFPVAQWIRDLIQFRLLGAHRRIHVFLRDRCVVDPCFYYAPCTCRMRSYPCSFYDSYHPWYSLTCIKRRISYVYLQVFLLHVSLFYYFEKYTHWITLQETQIFVRVQMNYSQCYIDPTGHTTTINMLSFTGVVWC